MSEPTIELFAPRPDIRLRTGAAYPLEGTHLFGTPHGFERLFLVRNDAGQVVPIPARECRIHEPTVPTR